MAEITSAFIRYEVQHGEEIVDWKSAGSGWTAVISTLEESDYDAMLRQWLGTVLYLEYIESEVDNQLISNFRSSDRYDVSADLMEQTIDEILSEDLDPRSRIDSLPGQVDPIEFPRSGPTVPPLTNPNSPFDKWLELRKEIYLDRAKGDGMFAEIEGERGDDGQGNDDGDTDS
jgi:hypothetical protein